MYPLQTLFEIRERAKKDSEEHYAQEKKKLDEVEKKLKEMQEELKNMQVARAQKREQHFQQMTSGKVSIQEIKIGERHLQMLLERELAYQLEIKQQEQVVQEAKEKVHEALEAMTKATTEYKVLEKHKEKWTHSQKKEQEKKEEEAADDITQSRYNQHLKELEDV